MGPITLYVIAKALRQLVSWRELGLHTQMSVNLSARNLLDPDLACQIEALLREFDVPPELLTVEVTESATLANPERAVGVLAALRESGIGVAIDDFGTGHASIAYLTRLPASEIKIDRALITDFCTDARRQAILRSTIDLGRHLDMHVVAEGIESEAVRERLAELGCETGQGYFISPPLDPDELAARLATPFGAHADTGAAATELRSLSARGPFVGSRADS